MADPVTPPGGGEGAAAPVEFTVNDDQSAADAMVGLGLLDDFGLEDDKPVSDPDDDEGSEDGAGESRPTGEEGEGQSEASATTPIEPPKSWSDEEKATFEKLPPEAKAAIARRESEREGQFTRQAQEIAENRKVFETERAAIDAQRAQYLQGLEHLVAFAIPEAQQFQNIDWAKLAAENPAEHVRLSAQRDALRGRIGAIQTEYQRVQAQGQQELQKRTGEILVQQKALLVQKVPDFGDAVKGPKLAADLGKTLTEDYGFSREEVGQAIDSRLVHMATDAMKWRQHTAALKAGEAKRSNPAPTVQRPGTAKTVDKGAVNAEKLKQFGRTNSTRDAAALLMDFL